MITYREWEITFDYGYFSATGPNYDVSWEGEEDGYVDNGQKISARTVEALRDEIDAAIAMARDSAETACPAPVPKDCRARAESIAQPVDKSGPSHD